jgi:hypothetical protein
VIPQPSILCQELGSSAKLLQDLEQILVQVGAVKQNDSRLKPDDSELEQASSSIKAGKPATATDDEDSDWD